MSTATTRVGIVTGLVFEAEILKAAAARLNVIAPLIACEGPGATQSRCAAEKLIAQGATHLLSFGIAAALDPTLQAGAIVVASGFRRRGGQEIMSDKTWADRMRRALPDAQSGAIADSADILGDAAEKSALKAGTNAMVADMESYGMAEVAAGRPCAAIRVVSDTAAQGLPLAARAGANPDGTVSIARVLTALAANPMQIPALYRLGRSTGVATKRLAALADLGFARGFFAGGFNE